MCGQHCCVVLQSRQQNQKVASMCIAGVTAYDCMWLGQASMLHSSLPPRGPPC